MKFYHKIFREDSLIGLPHTLRRNRVYILPTRYGFLFMLILAGMLLGSVNHNNNLGFLLTFLLSGMLFISMMHTYRNLIGIQILTVSVSPVFAGEIAIFEFLLRIDNLPRAAVMFAFSKGDKTFIDIVADADNRVEVSSTSTHRGVFRPGHLLISTQYPFGLFRSWSTIDLNLKCLVYPKPAPAKIDPSHGRFEGAGDGKYGGAGVEDFWGLKPYQPGDSLQHISWKAYSRSQGLFTKTFIGQSGTSIILDWYDFKEKDTERRLSMLCDMVLKVDRMNIGYGLNLPGTSIEPDKGEAHKRRCLKALALFGISPESK